MLQNQIQSKIIAPACSVKEAEEVLDAGADEIYFGFMPGKWVNKYGNSDLISRRQSQLAHITSTEQLNEIVKTGINRNKRTTLVLNSKYSKKQAIFIKEAILQWEQSGGHSLMVSDIGILLWLLEQNSTLERHLSVLSGVFNSDSLQFFEKLKISRVVLPRELLISEIAHITRARKNHIDFEIIIFFQRCEFIDSFCSFYHAVNYHPFFVNGHDHLKNNNNFPLMLTHDINYKGHGCQLPYVTPGCIQVEHLRKNESSTPYCGACSIPDLHEAGVRYFKIAGRGYPVKMILNSIKLLRFSLDNITAPKIEIKNKYKEIFGARCLNFCYYNK